MTLDDEEEESDESPTAARRIDAKDVTKDKPVKKKEALDGFDKEIEAEAQPDVQSEDDGFVEKGNYSPGGAKPSTATPNPKRKLDLDNPTLSNPKVNSNSVRNNLIIIQKLINRLFYI